MTLYSNGEIPLNRLVQFDTGGGKHMGTLGTRERWYALRRNVEEKYGRTLKITPGWNVYRPMASQKEARTNACNSGNCAGAAVPGRSSHGGTYQGRDALAIDVGNYAIIGRDAFFEEARRVGFVAGAITESVSGIKGGEPWHIMDFDPHRVVEEDDMPDLNQIFNTPSLKNAEEADVSLAQAVQGLDIMAHRIENAVVALATIVGQVQRKADLTAEIVLGRPRSTPGPEDPNSLDKALRRLNDYAFPQIAVTAAVQNGGEKPARTPEEWNTLSRDEDAIKQLPASQAFAEFRDDKKE